MTKQPAPHNLNAILDSMMTIDGALGAVIVDAETGDCVGEKPIAGPVGADQAAGISADTLKLMGQIGRMMVETENMEDIVSTFSDHQFVARPLEGREMGGLVLFLILERRFDCDILAPARYQLMHLVFGVSVSAQVKSLPETAESTR
jgi:hypothetical protein